MTNEKETITAWIASQRAKYKVIDGWQDIQDNEKGILKHHITTPYFHFAADWNEKTMLEQSSHDQGETGGRESGGRQSNRKAEAEASNPAEPSRANSPITAAANPAQSRVNVTVIGNTQMHKEWLKSFKFRWDPYKKWWYGSLLSEDVAAFEKECVGRKMQIAVG